MHNRSAWISISILVSLWISGCTSVDDSSSLQIRVSPETAVQLEGGNSALYSVSLSPHAETVTTVFVSALPADSVQLSSDKIVFLPDMAFLNQGVAVTCLPHAEAQNRHVEIVFSLEAAAETATVSREIVCLGAPKQERPEPGAILLSDTQNLSVDEDGASVQVEVALSHQPTLDVTVTATSSDETECVVSPQTLVFNKENYATAQSLTISGVADDDVDGDQTCTIQLTSSSDDERYSDLESMRFSVVNRDVDVEKGTWVVSDTQNLSVDEDGASVQVEVALSHQPTLDVTVTATSSDETECVVSPQTLVFNKENYATAQSLTISGVADDDVDGDQTCTIQLTPSSDDERYSDLESMRFSVVNRDVDIEMPASFTVTPDVLTVKEGAQTSLTIRPDTAPNGMVTVYTDVSDSSEIAVQPQILTFTAQNYETAQSVVVSGIDDGEADGDQTAKISFRVVSTDERFDGYAIAPVDVTVENIHTDTVEKLKLRVMAANITSGNYQGYAPGHGARIMQAMKPDIVLIQEFNYNGSGKDTDEDIRSFVRTTFGSSYYYTRGDGSIPNGVISRYPILEYGHWPSNQITNRNWDWAVIDLPGSRDLFVVSVHLSTDKNAREMPVLMERIEEKVAADKKLGKSYYLMIGGDFNTSGRTTVINNMSDIFETDYPYPVDQNGEDSTNQSRKKPYDWLLCSPDWCKYEVPVKIGSHVYANGHVFDSRVYAKKDELDDVPPVEANDSGASNMQHMAVIRDFELIY